MKGNSMMSNVDDLGKLAINTVVRAGNMWFQANGHYEFVKNASDDQLDALIALYKEYCMRDLGTALADAQEAFICGMNEVANQQFLAALTITGTQAASHWFKAQNDN